MSQSHAPAQALEGESFNVPSEFESHCEPAPAQVEPGVYLPVWVCVSIVGLVPPVVGIQIPPDVAFGSVI